MPSVCVCVLWEEEGERGPGGEVRSGAMPARLCRDKLERLHQLVLMNESVELSQ